jgi:glucosylceramidase
MIRLIPLLLCCVFSLSYSFGQLVAEPQVWLTHANQSSLLNKKPLLLSTINNKHQLPLITLQSKQAFQTIDGFGYTLTGGSAMLIQQLPDPERKKLLKELFGRENDAIGISCLRISLGASDLSNRVFSYDDVEAGKKDMGLSRFSLSDDTLHLIPLLKEILAINPDLYLMASPWSAPKWMKTNGSSKGGKLKKEYYDVYAHYMMRYILEMQKRGINITALTLQNEPHHGGNNPSMVMEPEDQALFVKAYLGPLFKTNKIKTKIIIWDHNCDESDYPIKVLQDSLANPYIDGTAFHLYAGEITALSKVKEAFPKKNLYFTEQWTGKNGSFDGDLLWHTRHVIIGSIKHWSRIALEWNLANDKNFGPHTPGGCTECKGALTINGNSIERNVAYYIIAHASKFVIPGSVRIGTNEIGGIAHVAFKRPDGRLVLILLNDGNTNQEFGIEWDDKYVRVAMDPRQVATVVL